MRPIKPIAIVLVCLTLGCAKSAPENKFAGVWQGTDHFGQTMKFTLKPDGQLQLHVSSPRQSFSKSGTYEIDLTKQPAHFDVKLNDREIRTIVEQIDEQHIAFENIGSSRERPASFGDQRIVLERQ